MRWFRSVEVTHEFRGRIVTHNRYMIGRVGFAWLSLGACEWYNLARYVWLCKQRNGVYIRILWVGIGWQHTFDPYEYGNRKP